MLITLASIRTAMLAENWDAVAEWLLLRHGVDITATAIAEACKEPLKRLRTKDNKWSDGTWDMRLRVRIDHLHAWPTVPWRESFEDLTPTQMHVFFPFLSETIEMLARLPEGSPAKAKPARSKISATNLVEITPIDATAARVL